MRPKRSTPKIMHRAGELRRELTPAEHKLWAQLRNDQLGVNFRRQHAIGKFIVDFCSPRKKTHHRTWRHSLRSQHLDQQGYDEERTWFLQAKGYKVLRFWNNEIMNDFEAVSRVILDVLNGTGV